MNKPTRLRMILVRHLEEANPDINHDKINALEEDIKTFVQSVVHGIEELGLEIKSSNFIGNLD